MSSHYRKSKYGPKGPLMVICAGCDAYFPRNFRRQHKCKRFACEEQTMKQLHWNTGCGYTVKGQRITATLHDDNVVTFNDHDRGVCGEFKLGTDSFTKETVMHRYLHNQVQFTSRSHQDAMYAGACNAEYKGE